MGSKDDLLRSWGLHKPSELVAGAGVDTVREVLNRGFKTLAEDLDTVVGIVSRLLSAFLGKGIVMGLELVQTEGLEVTIDGGLVLMGELVGVEKQTLELPSEMLSEIWITPQGYLSIGLPEMEHAQERCLLWGRVETDASGILSISYGIDGYLPYVLSYYPVTVSGEAMVPTGQKMVVVTHEEAPILVQGYLTTEPEDLVVPVNMTEWTPTSFMVAVGDEVENFRWFRTGFTYANIARKLLYPSEGGG